eukprot:329030-Alexandrium_andersonii.AAC.1
MGRNTHARARPSGQGQMFCPETSLQVGVPARPTGNAALSAARNLQTSEPLFSEAGAGDAVPWRRP